MEHLKKFETVVIISLIDMMIIATIWAVAGR